MVLELKIDTPPPKNELYPPWNSFLYNSSGIRHQLRIHGNLKNYGSIWHSTVSITLGFLIMTGVLVWTHEHYGHGHEHEEGHSEMETHVH